MPSLMTVPQFCADNGLCKATFYQLVKEGRGPRVSKIGRSTRIAAEDAAAWRETLKQPAQHRRH